MLASRRGFVSTVSVTALVGVCIAACVGDNNNTIVTSPDADGGGGQDSGASADGSVTQGGMDGSTTGSEAGGADAGCAAAACMDNGASLSCGGVKTTCAYGCAPAAGSTDAHCRVFDPTGAVDPSDLAQAGLKDFAGKNLKFFTETGRITTSDEATEIRPANATATVEEVSANGIGFRLVPGKLGIFQFKNFTLQAAAFLESNGATGNVPLAIVAAEEVKIDGVLDLGCGARLSNDYASAGSNPGSGMPADNKTQVDGKGPGGGKAGGISVMSGNTVISGGGGGGHGVSGGPGGDGVWGGNMEPVVFGGNGGAAYDDGAFDPPLGGSGGGAGNAPGGGGGGALQIVAGIRITIGDGAGPDAGVIGQGISTGACGGAGGGVGSTESAGGGGSGGTILLEAPEVIGKANAGLASNGGGGGGALNAGDNGKISSTPAAGAPAVNCNGGAATQAFGSGGNGGAGATPSGTKGEAPSGCGFINKYGGGGGGSAGRVRILTLSGDITADPSFVISPSVAPSFQKAKIATR